MSSKFLHGDDISRNVVTREQIWRHFKKCRHARTNLTTLAHHTRDTPTGTRDIWISKMIRDDISRNCDTLFATTFVQNCEEKCRQLATILTTFRAHHFCVVAAQQFWRHFVDKKSAPVRGTYRLPLVILSLAQSGCRLVQCRRGIRSSSVGGWPSALGALIATIWSMCHSP